MMDQTPDIASSSGSEGLWISVSALAVCKGVTKQTISERVARLVDAGKLEVKPGKGRAKLINVAQYDRAVGETTDLSREQGAQTRSGSETAARDGTFTKHQADRAGYEAELKRLDLEERLGRLRTVADIENATVTCGETVVRLIKQLVLSADEIAAAVAKDGVTGARNALKHIEFDLCTRIAEAFTKIAAADDAATSSDQETPTQ